MSIVSLLVAFFAFVRASFGGELNAPTSCVASSLVSPIVPNAKITSITAEIRSNITVTPGGHLFSPVSALYICDVEVYLTHPGIDDNVLVEVWLPQLDEGWNGRFQATGGGGFATGLFDLALALAVKSGYAAASTDGGHQGSMNDFTWALKPDRTVDWPLLQNFAARSLADQVYVGKSITEQYYGRKPHHSYWVGCSQGGRQGYALAQKFPDLLDGILANAPALGLSAITLGDLWPQIAMKEEGVLMSNCEFDWFEAQVMEACDLLDGVRDGIIEDPEICPFDPSSFVGRRFHCGGEEVGVTEAMANVVKKTYQGPQTPYGHEIWFGLPHGTSTRYLANISISADNIRSPNPFAISAGLIQNLLLKDPNFNVSTLTYTEYVALWLQAHQEYDWILNDEKPDLASFRAAGGKLLSWHGINDPVIPYQNTVQYRKRIELVTGGAKKVDEFYRLFLAPGVAHCGLGAGPVPKDALEKLVDWVENGEAPKSLDAETVDKEGELVTRETCLYPSKSKYMGLGDAKRASSWSCEGGEDEEDTETLDTENDFFGDLKDRLMGLGMGLKIG